MFIEYKAGLKCKCPVNGAEDSYEVTVHSYRTILVEEILQAIAELEGETALQEEITEQLAGRLRARVETRGYHSGVLVVVSA